MTHRRSQSGFTLIEIAIVLVIIGLLLGGILKGQELITSARVRNLISQQDGVKAAFYGFQDRFRALPGDYSQATTNIQGVTAAPNGNGNGDGQITTPSSGTNEIYLVWEHLSKSGFINGNYVYATAVGETTTPKNPYGQYVRLAYDNVYAVPSGTPVSRHNLKTGNQIPVEIMAEVDRKVDDGQPTTGSFVYAVFSDGGTAPPAVGTGCVNSSTPAQWILTGSTEVNCGGSSLL
ncbi:MAG: prepilin-type N-terminal cleavage/methylation domain-containing protein [Burkholderiales bacterium]|jgi:prepilin-type N-terminal cleavage/methylation domain-containing protein|nr:prepilin-type N-terminal cleavage/methylation domain-containing protein [Burkholderiales bacterium]